MIPKQLLPKLRYKRYILESWWSLSDIYIGVHWNKWPANPYEGTLTYYDVYICIVPTVVFVLRVIPKEYANLHE